MENSEANDIIWILKKFLERGQMFGPLLVFHSGLLLKESPVNKENKWNA